MSYIKTNLIPGETIIKQATMHWIIYAMPVFVTLIFAYITLIDAADFSSSGYFKGIIICGAFWLYAYLKKVSTELAVTNKRVIAKKGIIFRKTIELNLNKVESLTVDQDIIERLINCGSITINGTGGSGAPFKNIDDPLAFRKAVNGQIEKIGS